MVHRPPTEVVSPGSGQGALTGVENSKSVMERDKTNTKKR